MYFPPCSLNEFRRDLFQKSELLVEDKYDSCRVTTTFVYFIPILSHRWKSSFSRVYIFGRYSLGFSIEPSSRHIYFMLLLCCTTHTTHTMSPINIKLCARVRQLNSFSSNPTLCNARLLNLFRVFIVSQIYSMTY